MRLILYFIFTMLTMCFIAHHVNSQDLDSTLISTPKSGINTFDVRPTFFEMSVRTLPAINYYPAASNHPDSRFKPNRLYNVKLNVPVILSEKLDIISQFRYKNEALNLGGFSEADEKEIHFDNLGLSILFKYQLNKSYFLAGHLGGFFKADKLTFERYSSILDYNSSLMIGKNLGLGTAGFGLIFGNSLGRFHVYPLFLLDYQLSDDWKLEMKLPKELLVRRTIKHDNFYLLGGAELNGATYFISQDIYNGLENLEYRRGSIDLKIGVEKEIYDFLWIGADIGLSQPLFSAVVQNKKPTRNKLFDFDHSFSPYCSFSIFMVPPKSLFNKIK